MPATRSTPTIRCAKSWQTPERAAHASAAVESTVVVPGRYASDACRKRPTATAKSLGVADSARSGSSAASRSSGGVVHGDAIRYSHHSSARPPSSSHVVPAGTGVAPDVSTVEVATTSSSSWSSCTSNAVTVEPQ